MFASSIRATTSMRDRSATSISTVPGLFIVPVIAISPTSTFSRVTTPSIGERMVV